jgi:hypothetical protein
MLVTYEFHSAKPEQVGTSETWTVKQKKKT